MKNLTRREFLKAFVSLAALALPRPKGDAVASRDDKAMLAGTGRASSRLIDDEPTVTIFDMLADFNETVMAQADRLSGEPIDSLEILVESDSYECFENMVWTPGNIELGATVYLSWDKGNSWEYAGECEVIEPEYGKCSACGSPDWTLAAKVLRCTDCGAEDVDPRVAD